MERLRERYELAIERIAQIKEENMVSEPFRDYFVKTADFILQIADLDKKIQTSETKDMSLEQLQQLNEQLYHDILPEQYETSYANPTYAISKLGREQGQILSFLYTEIRGMIAYAYENRLFDLTIYSELYLEIYSYYQEVTAETYYHVSQAIYYFMKDYSEDMMEYRTLEQYDVKKSFAVDIIMNSDLSDPRYLYQFGEYISENEIKTAAYLSSLSQEKIDALAKTYTEGFRIGFVNARIDLTKKASVNIRYNVGFERIVKAAILQFREMGLEPIIYRAAVSSMCKRQNLKIGYCSTSPNRQYDYDHRFDDGLYLDKGLLAKKLVNSRKIYETYQEIACQLSGPAVIEIFGEKPFTPMHKEEAVTYTKKQQELMVEYRRNLNLALNEFVPMDQISFTIIAFPVPEIGEQFEEIFHETVKVNTLDMEEYKKIQQSLIDALDQGEKVRILGNNGNQTDLTVSLMPIANPEKETIFENCLADVNIPVGEVFTSPQLKGTNGVLHVSKVFLNDLEYHNLKLEFKDGMIADYTCTNFEKEDANRNYVKENVLYQRETLPMGEFAIGTNTTAYMMGKKYGISHMLPILIAEKTGPHFAVGDTCYSMSEDTKVYNPDGKEIISRDNECSILRKTDIAKAYFNCHTDITIPYNELGEITVITKDGKEITLIKDGRFVLDGTEALNDPFDEK